MPPNYKLYPFWPELRYLNADQIDQLSKVARSVIKPYSIGGYKLDFDEHMAEIFFFYEKLRIKWASIKGGNFPQYFGTRLRSHVRFIIQRNQLINIPSNGVATACVVVPLEGLQWNPSDECNLDDIPYMGSCRHATSGEEI